VATDGDLERLLSGCDLPPEVTAVIHRTEQTLDRELVRADRLVREATSLRKTAEGKAPAPPVAPTIPAGGVPVAGAARLLSHKSQIQGRAMRGGASRGEGRWPSAGGSHFTNGRRQQQTHLTGGGRGASIGGGVLGHKAPPSAAISSTSPGARVASHADGVVAFDGRIATPPTDAHTDVRAHARKQRAADTTDDGNAAATVPKKISKQRSVTASAAGRRKQPSPPQTADGAVGVERGHGGENAAMIGPGVGIRTGGGRGDPFAALADVTRTSGGTNAPRPLCSPAPQDGPKTLTLTTNHSGYMNEEMELVDAVERVVYRYALVAIQFLDSSEAMEAALRRSRHVSFHQSPSSPPLDANGASSATMPRRVPDLRLPATLSSQSRHHHQRQQQRFPPTAAPQPPHAMAFAKTPLLPLKASGAEAAIGVDKGGIRRGGLPCRRTRQ